MIDKGVSLPVDAIMMDIEDGVAPARKKMRGADGAALTMSRNGCGGSAPVGRRRASCE